MGKIRATAGLLVLCMLSILLSGCDGIKGKEVSAEETAEKKLTFYYPRDGSQIIKELVLIYNDRQNDMDVDPVEIPGTRTEFAGKLKALLNAGEVFPDVLLIHDTWLVPLAEARYIQPLDGGLSEEKKSGFFPCMMDAMVWNGETYGLPFWQDTPLLYYRSDLVATPPATWEQAEQEAADILAADAIPIGLLFPGKPQENAAAFLSGFWSAYHACPDFRSAEVLLDEAAMTTAWNRMNSMVTGGVISADVLNMSAENCRSSFEKGNAVFMWNWSYAARLFQREESPLHGKFGVIPVPASADGTGSIGILSGYAMVMSKKTSVIPEVWSFMQYMTGEESQRGMMDAGLMPSRSSFYEDSAWLNEIGLPSWFGNILGSGQVLKLGPKADGRLNEMSQALALAVGQKKGAADLMLFMKEGIVPGEQSEEPLEDGPAEEADKNMEGSTGTKEE